MARRPQGGQALVLLLALMAGLLGAWLVAFNAGQLVNGKLRLANAADAAAYSAALWEARSLNYQAYLNRAIVANEVAIAQSVSLRSWSRYLGTVTRNVGIATRYVPPLAAPMQALARGWGAVDRTLQAGLPPLEVALSRWNADVLASAQAIAHQQALLVAADLVPRVVAASEPRARVTDATRLFQVQNGQLWQNRFTERSERGGGDLARFTRLLMDSRDGFTRDRRHDLPIDLPLLSMPRRGGTDLLGERSWRAVDTWSVHLDLLLDDVEIPVGWGAAEQRLRPVATRGTHGGSLSRNPRAARLAQRELAPLGGYAGVPQIRDVVRPREPGPRTLRYSVALAMSAPALATADRVVTGQGLAGPDGPPESVAPAYAGDALHALASAEVHFQRPAARSDGRSEYPSLFSPYWQARLVATPAADRQLAAPARGLAVDPFAVLP